MHPVRLSFLLIVCACLIQPKIVQAAEDDRDRAVNLIAPEGVRKIVEKYFPLPDKRIKDENERAIFMRRAQSEIPDLLATEGYFTSSVVLRNISKDGILELEVIPGVQTRVSEVSIEFRGDLSLPGAQRSARVQKLREEWTMKAGTPFRATSWDDAKADLLASVANQDYATARLVESSAQVDPAGNSAILHVVVDSGPRYLFGELKISGLERYEELLVTRYASFRPGQPYQRDLLVSFQTKLQNLPQFSSVIVNLDMSGQDRQKEISQEAIMAPVNVQIVEAQSRKISLGIGYSTNNGVRKEVGYQSYNFMNQAWTLSGDLVFEQNRQSASVALDTPPNPRGYHITWTGSGEKTQIQGLETRRDKLGVTRSRTLYGIDTGIGMYWQQEQRIPLGGIRETDQALVFDWRWTIRRVDNPMLPMSGYLTEIRLGGASRSMLSDQDFVRSYMRYQHWFPLGESDVISPRIEAGYTASTSRLGIPQEYLFRVGGTQTVRGFAYQSLGFVEGSAVVGGRAMVTGSAEYTHWFNNWGAALFYDVGDATDTAPELRLSQGYGVGVRWRSPVGPLALDFAHGKGQPDTRIHFSIAVAF